MLPSWEPGNLHLPDHPNPPGPTFGLPWQTQASQSVWSSFFPKAREARWEKHVRRMRAPERQRTRLCSASLSWDEAPRDSADTKAVSSRQDAPGFTRSSAHVQPHCLPRTPCGVNSHTVLLVVGKSNCDRYVKPSTFKPNPALSAVWVRPLLAHLGRNGTRWAWGAPPDQLVRSG